MIVNFFTYQFIGPHNFQNVGSREYISLLIKKRDLSVCLSVCLSGYTFRHVLMSHADILDIDRGQVFRRHRHKNNKKVAVIYEKTVKNRPLPGYLPTSCYGARALKVRFPTCVMRTRTYLTRKA